MGNYIMILSKPRQEIIPLIFAGYCKSNAEIVEITGYTQTTVRQTLIDLEKLELIKIETNKKDKRINDIILLEKNANKILCKLFGFDPMNPFENFRKHNNIINHKRKKS